MTLRLIGLLIAACGWQMASAATPASTLSEMSAKFAAGNDRQAVIIRYGSGFLEPANQTKIAERRSAKLSGRKSQLMAVLKSKPQRRMRSYDYLPLVAANIDQAEFDQLSADPDITIYQNRIYRPMLAQSVARVYPTQNASTFHGDNEWAVAVIDSGVDKAHPFLTGKVLSEACFSDGGGQPVTTSLCPGGVTSSTAANSALPCTLAGCDHGTRVAGVAAGNGSSVDGVARDAKLISMQVYSRFDGEEFCFPAASCIGAFNSDIIAALERVYALRNTFSIAAVNLSLGSSELFSGTCDEQPEKPIIDLLRAAGIAVVAASGNASNTSMTSSPACISSAISVAATLDTSDTPFAGNNTSAALDLFAPGVNINSSVPGGGFSNSSGTSMAAPHVAGAFAVLRQARPSASVQANETLLKSVGPLVSQNGVARKRLAISSALQTLFPGSQPGGPAGGNSVVGALFLLLGDD